MSENTGLSAEDIKKAESNEKRKQAAKDRAEAIANAKATLIPLKDVIFEYAETLGEGVATALSILIGSGSKSRRGAGRKQLTKMEQVALMFTVDVETATSQLLANDVKAVEYETGREVTALSIVQATMLGLSEIRTAIKGYALTLGLVIEETVNPENAKDVTFTLVEVVEPVKKEKVDSEN